MLRMTPSRLLLLSLAIWSVLTLVACSGDNPGASPTEDTGPTKVARPVTGNTGAPSPTLEASSTVKPGSTTVAPNPTAKPAGTAAANQETTFFSQNTPPKAKQLKMRSPEYGVQAFMWWRPEAADRDLGLARAAGFTWVKQSFAWRDIEGAKKGVYNWSNPDQVVFLAYMKQVDLLIRLDNAPDWAAPGCYSAATKQMGPAKNTQDWIDFVTAVVRRYKGFVRAYEVWNEPNLSREWCGRPPNPAEYGVLLKASYAAIKSADPNAMVISAGLTPTTQSNAQAMPDTAFVEKLYDSMRNNSAGYFDVLGVHAPGFKAPPEMSPDDVAKNSAYNHGEGAAGRIYAFRHAEDIRKIMVARGDGAKQIAILEFGWTSDSLHPAYSWFRVDEPTKAQYIVNAYKYARDNWSPWIGVMSLIYLANPDWDKNFEEYWWAITEPDGTPRAAFVEMQKLKK